MIYTRKQLAKLVTQPQVIRGKVTTLKHPTSKSIGVIVTALQRNLGVLAKEQLKSLPNNLSELTGIKHVFVSRGKISSNYIPLIQYCLDNSEFAYLDKESFDDWLTMERLQILLLLYRENYQQPNTIQTSYQDVTPQIRKIKALASATD